MPASLPLDLANRSAITNHNNNIALIIYLYIISIVVVVVVQPSTQPSRRWAFLNNTRIFY